MIRSSPPYPMRARMGQYLREHCNAPETEGPEPLTGEAVAQALKRHADAAGLDPDQVTVHGLRHLGAELCHRASGDARETQRLLDPQRSDTTAVYLKQLR